MSLNKERSRLTIQRSTRGRRKIANSYDHKSYRSPSIPEQFCAAPRFEVGPSSTYDNRPIEHIRSIASRRKITTLCDPKSYRSPSIPICSVSLNKEPSRLTIQRSTRGRQKITNSYDHKSYRSPSIPERFCAASRFEVGNHVTRLNSLPDAFLGHVHLSMTESASVTSCTTCLQ